MATERPSLDMISKIVNHFPDQYKQDFTSQVQAFYEQYLSIMSPNERHKIDQYIQKTTRNQERGRRAGNTRRTRAQQWLFDNEEVVGPTLREEIDFYNQEEFSEAGIRRRFEGFNEEFIQERIRETNQKRAMLQQGLRPN